MRCQKEILMPWATKNAIAPMQRYSPGVRSSSKEYRTAQAGYRGGREDHDEPGNAQHRHNGDQEQVTRPPSHRRAGGRGTVACHPSLLSWSLSVTLRYSCPGQFGAEFILYKRSEMLAALFIVRVPVEARATRRQHDRVAGDRKARCGLDSFAHGLRLAHRRPARKTPSRTSLAASPIATTARTGGTVLASSERSRPLLRPPAISTTEENPRTPASTAAGVVALESSYQRHAVFLATSCTRCGGGRVLAAACRQPSCARTRGHGDREAAAVLARSWGNALGKSPAEGRNRPGRRSPRGSPARAARAARRRSLAAPTVRLLTSARPGRRRRLQPRQVCWPPPGGPRGRRH